MNQSRERPTTENNQSEKGPNHPEGNKTRRDGETRRGTAEQKRSTRNRPQNEKTQMNCKTGAYKQTEEARWKSEDNKTTGRKHTELRQYRQQREATKQDSQKTTPMIAQYEK